MATNKQEAFEAYFKTVWPEPSDGVMYCRPQMEMDFNAGWSAAIDACLLNSSESVERDTLIALLAEKFKQQDAIGGESAYGFMAEAALDIFAPIIEQYKQCAASYAQQVKLAQTPLLQEIAALKGDLRLEDLPPEGARTKLDEWQACYAALFRQMNEAVAKHVALLEAVRVAYGTLQAIHYANAGDSPQTTEMARLASEALRPFLIEEGKDA